MLHCVVQYNKVLCGIVFDVIEVNVLFCSILFNSVLRRVAWHCIVLHGIAVYCDVMHYSA